MDLSYPRPDFDRSDRWASLEGKWEFARGDGRDDAAFVASGANFPERILVPFPWESERSGVGANWLERGWYRRQLEVPATWRDERTVLFFGGVQQQFRVYVNGERKRVERSAAGQYECDITDSLGSGKAELVVRVDNPVDKALTCHGKQRTLPPADYDNCSFQPSSGIWQPVWLEPRPATYLRSIRLGANQGLDALCAEVTVAGPHADGALLELAVVGSAERLVITVPPDRRASAVLQVRGARAWSPADPYLYFVEARLSSIDGIDKVTTYTGLRHIEVVGKQLNLNGERLFVRGVLDQGFWPGTGWTPPDVNALRQDLELAKAAGYNLVRKHVKLEDPRWLYLADTMGLLVWSEPPSPSRYSEHTVTGFRDLVYQMVSRDANHPSIVIWGLFNEEWGLEWALLERVELQEVVREATKLLRSLDPSRPMVDNSGWSHVSTDIVDWHYYEPELVQWIQNLPALIAGGEVQVPVPLRPPLLEMKPLGIDKEITTGRPSIASEYGAGLTSVDRGWFAKWQTQELRRQDSLSGYVYTELYDIEYESFGLYSADRRVKDLGNFEPADFNAATVIIADLLPERPGLDVRAINGHLEVDLRVSHHGNGALSGRLVGSWGPVMGTAPSVFPNDELVDCVVEVSVEPYTVTRPHRFSCELPASLNAGRIHLGYECDGDLVARSCIDVARAGPDGALMTDANALVTIEEEP